MAAGDAGVRRLTIAHAGRITRNQCSITDFTISLNLARKLADARRIVAFTGAGISTESGIPDFRSPGGVWSRMKPITYQEFVASEDKRREAWTRAFTGKAGWTGRAPNAGHFALARLHDQGRLSAVITQNVDNLHQDSGLPAEKVIEARKSALGGGGNAH